jgi:large subunit ribosomal protein L34
MSKRIFNHRKKEEISTDLWTEWLLNGRKVLARRRAKGRHKLTVSCEPRHKK